MVTSGDGLPVEVELRTLAGGVAYELPRRPLGPLRWIGVVFIVVGVLCTAGAIGSAAGATLTGWSVFDILWIAGSLLFLVPGGAILLAGLATITGRASVELHGDRLTHVERLGPLAWRWSRPTASVRRLEVRVGSVRRNGRVVADTPLGKIAALITQVEDGKPFLLAVGYPEMWLTPIAHDLAARLEDARDQLVGDGVIQVEVVKTAGDGTPVDVDDGPVDQPEASDAVLTPTADGVTLVLPPTGVWKTSGGLFGFSVLWCGFMTFFTAGSVVWPLISKGVGGLQWMFVAFNAGFWAIGLGMMIAGINMGRRHAIIDVVDDVLLINRKNIFGIKSHQWPAAQIESIHVASSGFESNDVPVLELKVQTSQELHGFFCGRDQAELRWIAWVLRQRLGPPRQAGMDDYIR